MQEQIMDQQVQEAYLAAMGVPLWYPRYELPNAPELSWPVIEEQLPVGFEPQVSSSSSAVNEVQVDNSLAKLKSLMADDEPAQQEVKTSIAEKQKETVAEVPLAAYAKDIVPPFGFMFFRYPLGVSIVVSVSSEDVLSSDEMRFINTILQFLGIADGPEFNHRVSWPLVQNNEQYSTRHFFRESMGALFKKQALNHGVNNFILFGRRLSSELSGLLKELSSESDNAVSVVESFELPEVFMSSSAKRELWKKLLPLKR